MSNETDNKEAIEYPNIVERFRDVFVKLGIKKHDAYVDHCAKGDLEDLEDVEEKLYEMGLHPSLRNQVITFWAAEIKRPVPPKLKRRLTEERGVKPREESTSEKSPEKYSVDTETGAIKVASTSDKTALTWEEAEKLSKSIKRELAEKAGKGERKVTYVYDPDTEQVRMAREGETGGTLEQAKELKKMAQREKANEGEAPFIQDAEGNWMLNPKAKITGLELLAFDSIRRAQARGEEIDPLDYVAKARQAFGTSTGMTDLIDAAVKLQELTKGDQSVGEALKIAIEKLTERGTEDSTTQELRRQIDALNTTIQQMREEQTRQQMESIASAISSLNSRLEELRTEMTSSSQLEGKYAILSKSIDKIDSQLSGVRQDVRPLIDLVSTGGTAPEPRKRSPEEAARVAKGLKEAVRLEQEAKRLEDELFFGAAPQG